MITGKTELIDVPISDLIPYERNPRKNDKAVKKVAASLEQFGLVKNSVVVDENMVLITGHTTTKAMRSLGWTTCPAVTQVFGLTEEEKRAYRIADNRLGELAEWDFDLLAGELASLDEVGFDAELTGFDTDALAELGLPEKLEVTEDDYEPPVEIETDIQRGDLFALGRHRLLCGDSTSAEDVGRLMGEKKAFACITSPPYASQRVYHGIGEWDTIVPPAITNAHNAVAGEGHILVNLGLVHTDGRVFEYWRSLLDTMASIRPLYSWYVWDKLFPVPGDTRGRLAICHEWIFHFAKAPRSLNKTKECKHAGEYHSNSGQRTKEGDVKGWLGVDTPYQDTKVPGSVIRTASVLSNTERTGHPAQYSLSFVAELMEPFTNVGESVYDPFLGSGTTLVACEQLGRTCYGMEISPQYCQVIIDRWEKLTGQKAERVDA